MRWNKVKVTRAVTSGQAGKPKRSAHGSVAWVTLPRKTSCFDARMALCKQSLALFYRSTLGTTVAS